MTLPLAMVVPPDGLSELTVELFGAPDRNWLIAFLNLIWKPAAVSAAFAFVHV